MGTHTVITPSGDKAGFTDPLRFKIGLKKYVKTRYGAVSLDSKAGTLSGIFDKSVDLIESGKIHFILFDWVRRKIAHFRYKCLKLKEIIQP